MKLYHSPKHVLLVVILMIAWLHMMAHLARPIVDRLGQELFARVDRVDRVDTVYLKPAPAQADTVWLPVPVGK
jgi:hypothetical protein